MKRLMKLLDEKLSEKRPKYRNVRIHPKVLEEKDFFTPEEKAALTKKGVYWYIYYDYKNPATGKFERQNNITNKVNQRFPDFDQRLQEIKLTKEAFIKLLERGLWSPYKKEGSI